MCNKVGPMLPGDTQPLQFLTGLCRLKAHQKLWSNKGPRTVSDGH